MLLTGSWEFNKLSTIINGEHLQRAYFSYCFFDGILFFYGGKSAQKDLESCLGKYNLSTNSLEIKAEWQGPGKRKSSSLVLNNESLILFGGLSNNRYLNDIWNFDLNTEKWSEMKTKGLKPLGRAGCLIFIISDKLFLYGGGNNKKVFSDCFYLDLIHETWSSASLSAYNEFTKERKKMAFCVVEKKIFVFGGLSDVGICCDSFDLFEFREDFSVSVKKLPCGPCKRFSCSLGEVKGKVLVVVGGKDFQRTFWDVWTYFVDGECWAEVETFNCLSSRSGHCSITYNEQLIILGGWNNSHFSDNDICTLQISSRKPQLMPAKQQPSYLIYPKKINTQYCVKLSQRPKPEISNKQEIEINENQFIHSLNLLPSNLKLCTSQYLNHRCALLHICRTWVSLSISIQIRSTVSFIYDRVCKIMPKSSVKKAFNSKRSSSDKEFHIRQKILNSWERVSTKQLNILKISIKPIMPQINFIYDVIKFPNILSPFLKLSETVLIVTKFEEFHSVFLCKKFSGEFFILYTILDKNLQVVFPNESLANPCLKNILANSHFKNIKEVLETKFIDVFLYTDKFKKTENNEIVDEDEKSLRKIMERSGDLEVHINKVQCAIKPGQKELISTFNDFKVYKSIDPEFSVLMYSLGKLVYFKDADNSDHCLIIEITNISLLNDLTGQISTESAEKILSIIAS